MLIPDDPRRYDQPRIGDTFQTLPHRIADGEAALRVADFIKPSK